MSRGGEGGMRTLGDTFWSGYSLMYCECALHNDNRLRIFSLNLLQKYI